MEEDPGAQSLGEQGLWLRLASASGARCAAPSRPLCTPLPHAAQCGHPGQTPPCGLFGPHSGGQRRDPGLTDAGGCEDSCTFNGR